jgi:hypothetical protein
MVRAAFPAGYSGERVFNKEDLAKVITDAGSYTATGPAGERMGVLKLLVKAGALNLFWLVADAFQRQLLPPSLMSRLRDGRLLPLYKDDSKTKLRPITISSLLGRLVEKAAARSIGSKAKVADMRSHQLAMGCSSAPGVAYAAIMAALKKHRGSIVMKMDYRNGYTSLSRSKVLEQLIARGNKEAALFFMEWNRATPKVQFRLVNGQVEEIAAEVGLDQGGACSPFFFSVAVDGVLRRLGGERDVFLALGYLDDLFLVLTPEAAKRLLQEKTVDRFLKEERTSLEVNPDKTQLFDPFPRLRVNGEGQPVPLAAEFADLNVGVSTEGIIVLGVPIFGSESWLDKQLAAAVHGLEAFLLKVELMEPQHAFAVMRHCAASRLTHLWRTVPCSHAKPHAKRAEDAIWLSACKILNLPLTPDEQANLGFDMSRARTLFFLPTTIGGFGIMSPLSAHMSAFLGGWALSLAELSNLNPEAFDWWCAELLKVAPEDELPGLALIRRSMRKALGHCANSVGSARAAAIKNNMPRAIAEDTLAKLPTSFEALFVVLRGRDAFKLQKRVADVAACVEWAGLFSKANTPIRAILRARTDPKCRNHLGALPGHSLLYMRHDEMIFLVRDSLCLPYGNVMITDDWIRTNNPRRATMFDPMLENYLRCLKLMREAHHSPTHTALGNILRLMVEAVGVNYRHETQYNERDAMGVKRRGDWSENMLRNIIKRTRTLYDQTVIDPSGDTYAAKAQSTVGFAAATAEEKKVEENKELCKKEGWEFCPAAAETTGGFGIGLQNLIKKCNDRASKYPESIPMCETWATPNFTAFWSQALRITVSNSLWRRWQGLVEAHGTV